MSPSIMTNTDNPQSTQTKRGKAKHHRYTEREAVEKLRHRPDHITSRRAIARWMDIEPRTLYRYMERWPEFNDAMNRIEEPTVQRALSEAQQQAIANGDIPRGEREVVLTAHGLKKLRTLSATQPALQHIAAELGLDKKTLADLIENHEPVRHAIEAGRADLIKMVSNSVIGRALDGDIPAAKLVFQSFAPELLTERKETLNRHEFSFAVPELPEEKGVRIIDHDNESDST